MRRQTKGEDGSFVYSPIPLTPLELDDLPVALGM